MENFTPVSALIGGGLIGLSASIMLLGTGRIAGISGIAGGLLKEWVLWRASFLAGLFAAGVALLVAWPQAFESAAPRPLPWVAMAGLLVGVGTRMGGGCTSGHGVCGLTRRSPRSLVATLTFMATGVVAAVVGGMLIGAGGG